MVSSCIYHLTCFCLHNFLFIFKNNDRELGLETHPAAVRWSINNINLDGPPNFIKWAKNTAIGQNMCGSSLPCLKKKSTPWNSTEIYSNIAICSFFLFSASLCNFLKNVLLPDFNSLFLLLFRSIYAIVFPPDNSLNLPILLLFFARAL
jgi:hypothetical protein